MNLIRSDGVESLAIPHNTNISGGVAFSLDNYNGGPIDESYSKNRSLNEPLVEIIVPKEPRKLIHCCQKMMNGQLLK